MLSLNHTSDTGLQYGVTLMQTNCSGFLTAKNELSLTKHLYLLIRNLYILEVVMRKHIKALGAQQELEDKHMVATQNIQTTTAPHLH